MDQMAKETYSAVLRVLNNCVGHALDKHERRSLAQAIATDIPAWQSINTAPKDGTPILLWLRRPVDRHYVASDKCPLTAIGFWDQHEWVSVETEDCGSMGGEYTGWMTDYQCLSVDPSHWMPIPAPPKE